MWYGLILVVHVLVCVFLIGIILVQGGRGGLSETFAGSAAQSLFGGGAVTVLTRMTTVCAILFGVTCLLLASFSTMRGRSVIDQVPMALPNDLPLPVSDFPVPVPQPSGQASDAAAPAAAPASPSTP